MLAKADFRSQDWLISSPSGTGSSKGMELDFAQNAIKLKDAGKFSWWFESPQDFFKGDMTLAYNGTVEFQLQSLEWEASFTDGYDIVLVAANKRHTIGLKGVKKDGETSKIYSVRLSETAGQWEHLNPVLRKDGGGLRTEAVKADMIKALSTLIAIRVRGGYYMGVEKTQLRSLKFTQGVQAGDEKLTAGDGECCSDRDRTCTTSEKFELVFDQKGLDCIEYTPVSTGMLIAGDNAGTAEKTVRLAQPVSSPDADFYRDTKMVITAGTCVGCAGTVTAYLGELSWAINSGVTSVEIESGGSNCSQGGVLAANGQSGSDFSASFDVLYTIPSMTLSQAGVGCTAATVEGPFAPSAVDATGGVTALADPAVADTTADGYISGRAIITCADPCTGMGLVVDCVADGSGDITGLTITTAGTGYTLTNMPSIYCPEGTVSARGTEGPFDGTSGITVAGGAVTGITLPTVLSSGYLNGNAIIECSSPCTGTGLTVSCVVDEWGDITALNVLSAGTGYSGTHKPTIKCRESVVDPPNPGTGFAGTFATVGGAIYGVAVTNAGTGYTSNIKILHVSSFQSATCIGMVWNPQPSGYFTSVQVLYVGSGFTEPPTLTISSGGEGCIDVVLRTVVGDATPDALVVAATSGGIISLRKTSADYRDGYYNGMTFVMLTGAASGQVREIESFVSVDKTITLKTPFTHTPAAADHYAITKTPALSLKNGHDFLTGLYGVLAGAMSCTCTGGAQTSVNAEVEATRGSCECEVTLASTASDKDDFYNGETIYFPEVDLAATIVDYTGGTKKAKIAARSSGHSGYNREIPADQVVANAAKYVMSARHHAKVSLMTAACTSSPVTVGGTFFKLGVPAYNNDLSPAELLACKTAADTDATSVYSLSYRDYTATMQAHQRGQPFFCEQNVGAEAEFIDMPFVRTFAFRSTPLICSTATLTVAAQGQLRDDLLWPENKITVFGEQGEKLGTLFTEPSTFLGMQEGGPVTDSITLSQEKMLEMTSDGDFVVTLSTDAVGTGYNGGPKTTTTGYNGGLPVPYPQTLGTPGDNLRGGALKFRSMKLSFSPAACYNGKVATDEYEVRDDVSPGRKELFYNLSFGLPPSTTGTPVSDGVITVTADADLADGYLELTYPDSGNVSLFSDWVWGAHDKVYALSEPADVAVTCTNNYNVDLQLYTITGVTITNGGSGCGATTTEGPFSDITTTAGGVVSAVALPSITGDGYISGKAFILSHGSGDGNLEVTCVANAGGDITTLTVSVAGTSYTTAQPPVIYCPEGTIAAAPTLGTTNTGANFAGVYATNGVLNGGAIIGVVATNVGTGYTKNVKITHVSTLNAGTCTSSVEGIGAAILAYQSVVPADPLTPARVCSRVTVAPLSGSRTARHTAHHRIPRRVLAKAAQTGFLPVSFKVKNAMSIKLSPVRLTYALMHCKLMTLNAQSGIMGLGVPAYQPSNLVLPFPDDAPPAAGSATLWVHAHIQNHRLHVRDTRGSPNGFPRGGILDTDSGEPYYSELDRARDPMAAQKMRQHYWPHLGAIRVRVGESGEAVDWMFLKDYSQYSPDGGYVDSLGMPMHIMQQFALGRKVTLTLEIPPGDSTIIIHSVVLAYPHTEA